jgi:rhodanese-related sulfurtransferase
LYVIWSTAFEQVISSCLYNTGIVLYECRLRIACFMSDPKKTGWFQRTISRVVGKDLITVNEDQIQQTIRSSELFKNLPDTAIEAILEHLEPVVLKEGDCVIKEGDDGDYYYILIQGKASVLKNIDGRETKVAELGMLASFGEEALISNAKRNATIKMLEGGIVIRLGKDNFLRYIKEPLLVWFSPMEALQKIREGSQWLDVRDEDDYRRSRLPHARSLPFSNLRKQSETMDKSVSYVCYCDNGRQSSTAAFLLGQRGFDVAVLRGGISRL